MRWFSRGNMAHKCTSCWNTKLGSNSWSFFLWTDFLQPSLLRTHTALAQPQRQYSRWYRACELRAPWGALHSDPGQAYSGTSTPTCTEMQGSHIVPMLWAEILSHHPPTAAQNPGVLERKDGFLHPLLSFWHSPCQSLTLAQSAAWSHSP